MNHVNSAKDKIPALSFVEECPRLRSSLVAGFTAFTCYAAYKIWKKYQYSSKQFNTKSEVGDKVILITGCGHGFGNKLSLQLSVDHGYRVIATCQTQASVDEFMSNSAYTANKSTAIVMDVTNEQHIADALEFTGKYLKETNSIFWGLVNNAGYDIFGAFELVPRKFDQLQRDVLLNGPLNIIRAFLPLFPGRMHYVANDPNNILEYTSDGGRIVNVSSVAARNRISPIRYGPCKAAISYSTHILRQELSPRFGIWCSVVEPGGFSTNIVESSYNKTKDVCEELKRMGKEDLIEIYQYDMEQMKTGMDQFVERFFASDMQPVLDDIIHGLVAKHPEREYIPGNSFMSKVWEHAPLSLSDWVSLQGHKKFLKLDRNLLQKTENK